MTACCLGSAAVSLLLLCAHFLRSGRVGLAAVCWALLFLLFVRRPFSRLVIQAALWLGCAEWLRTLVVLAAARRQAGGPVGRLALILGCVCAVTFLSAWSLRSAAARRYFDGPARGGERPLPAPDPD